MTDAINAYVQFFFKQYSESEIIATILDANTPSWKVAEKSGFNLMKSLIPQLCWGEWNSWKR